MSERFDLVIVDINMPKMDGMSFLRALRSQEGDAGAIPTLVISSESGERDAAAARAAGANFYLVKPVAACGSGAPCRGTDGGSRMNSLLEQFLLEGRDLIGEATRGLIELERAPDDGTLIAGVFRAFHTLKGSSGVFGIQPLTRMLHAAEDTLVAVRTGAL